MASSFVISRVVLPALAVAALLVPGACDNRDGSGGSGGSGGSAGSGGGDGGDGAQPSGSSSMSSGGAGSGGGSPCTTLEFAPMPASPIAWKGFPACDPQSDLCIVNPPPMHSLDGVSISPTGTAFAFTGNTLASWKGAEGSVYRVASTDGVSAIFAISDADVWAVGAGSFLAHFDGAKWTTSVLAASGWLSGVWASGPTDVWVVGNFGAVGHYTGSWSATSLPDDPSLQDVHGTGPSDVWAVGAKSTLDGGVIEHWDGSQWSEVPVMTDKWLEGVWAASSDDVWVVGRGGVVLRGNAQGFSPVAVPVATQQTQDYWDVWGSSPNDVWIVGTYDTLHFDGAAFTRSDPVGHSIAGRSATDVVAVGERAVRWDGAAWKEEFSVDHPSFTAAWAASPDDLWFVGTDGEVVRAKNGALTRATLGKSQLDAVWGSSPTDLWIAGGGTVYRGDGSTFCPIEAPPGAYVRELSGSGPDDVWALSDGEALHFDGTTWTTTSTGLNASSILAFSPTDVWTSGEDLRHWDGTSWTSPPTKDFPDVDPADSKFGPLWGSAPDDVWVAHDVFLGGNHMAHWDGVVFTQTMEDANTLGTLSGSAKDDIWSFGFYVRHYDGVSWSTIPSGRMPIEASVVTSKDVWAVGSTGLILRKTK